MREIKFRAWDNEEGKYYKVDNLYFPLGTKDWKDICIETEDGCEWRSIDECFLEQYTGLKDKNGKEIYEGDILKIFYKSENGYRTRPVVFDGGTFLFHETKNCDFPLDGCASDENHKGSHYCEIIGNIHQEKTS